MAGIAEIYTSNVSIGTTEISIVSATSTLQTITTAGVYQLFLDLNVLANGDVFEIKIYEKVRSAGTKRVLQTFVVANLQADPNWVSDSFILLNGWDMTLKKLSGTDRTIEASIRSVS